MEFLSRKKPKMGKEKNVMLSPLKAEVWGAYNFKCKNTGEPPQNFRGKRQGVQLECFEGRRPGEKLFRWKPANSRLSARSWELGKLQVQADPSQAARVLPSQQDTPFLGTSVRRGLQEWRVPPAYISGLTDGRLLLNSNCHPCPCSGSPSPGTLSSVKREDCC